MIHESGKLLLAAGPSLLENERVVMSVAEILKKLSVKYPNDLKVIFKSSFDKPHRSNLYSPRGDGIETGLELLAEVKNQFNFSVMTDIHERHQIESASLVCDALQIPSLLCSQNDLLVEAAKSGCTLNIRKGTHLSPSDALLLAEKAECAHASEVWITERGSNFGYNNFVVDMRSFTVLQRAECPLLIDATGVSLLPGVMPQKNSAAHQFALPLARAGLAAGAHGIFLDVHPEPENALVDNAFQLPLNILERFVDESVKFWKAIKSI